MKKNLLYFVLSLTMTFMVMIDLNAQDYLIYEGFSENDLPPGWTMDNVAWSNASSNAHNEFEGSWCAKFKPSQCSMTTRLIQSADTLTFWMKVKDLAADAHLYILKSTDGGTLWDTIARDPQDRMDDSTFQFIKVGIHDDPAEGIHIRWSATATGGSNTTGIFTIDDIAITKMTPAGDDATLISLKVDGELLPDFVYTKTEYSLEFPYGTVTTTVDAEAYNTDGTVNIIQPLNIHGTEASRTSTIEVTAKDGVTKKTYSIVFSVSPYVFAEGFSNPGSDVVPYDNWEVDYTYTHDHAGPNENHGEFPGIGAFKFVRGQPDKQGFLKFKYKYCGVLTFYLFVELPDGGEALKIETKAGFGLPKILNLTSDSLTTDWKKFVIEVNQADSVQFTFTPTLTADKDTRIWMDDISLTGFGFTPPSMGIFNINMRNNLQCYPNPATDLLYIDLGSISQGTILFYNVLGAVIREYPVDNPSITIDISQFESGIYFLSLKGNPDISPAKIVIR
jgi:hypothetical protein